MLDGKLVHLDGKRVRKFEPKVEADVIAFYFSAHWCPPCRAFTPKLVDFYNENSAKAGKKFEIVFVSNDRDEESMEEYIKGDKMPWPSIKYRYSRKIDEISKYSSKGIPCLVLVDKSGKVLSHSYEGENYVGPNKVMRDLGNLLK